MGKRLGGLIGAAVGIILVGPGNAGAATFDVDSTPDVTHVGGCTAAPDDCSIRDAVTAANASADPSSTINIPAGTYPVSAGQIEIVTPTPTTEIDVVGAGARSTTLDAGGASRVLAITNGVVRISGVTVTGGNGDTGAAPQPGDGGGIIVGGNATEPQVTLTDSTVTNNSAAFNGAGIALPSFHNTVAGGFDAGSLTLIRSTVSNNNLTGGAVPAAAIGAGVGTYGNLTVINSTITGNTIASTALLNMGGGIGAGIDPTSNGPSTVTITNSTIAGNKVGGLPTSAGGGLAIPSASASVALNVTNTIIAGNLVNDVEGDCAGLVAPTSANNLTGDGSCTFIDAGSIQADPQLGALSDNGGQTNTLLPAEGSAAIDAGTQTGCPETDQRGVTRPQRTTCDIGAVELAAQPPQPPPPPATKSADLSVSLTAKPEKPELGQKVKFSFEVSNAGPDEATSTVVKGKLPGRAKKVNPGNGCRIAKQGKRYRLTCEVGSLANGASREFSVKVKPKKGVRKPRATFRAASPVSDPNTANNKAKKKVTVERE